MMDTKALREKILDLAIRGKLVPQDPNDEPASLLLERIRAQKQQMVKDGKLKAKDIKDDTVIFKGEDNLHYEKFADGTVKCIEDEIPFDLPAGWAWVRLKGISSAIQYGLNNSAEQYGTHRLLRITDIQDGKVNWSSVPYTTVKEPDNYLLSKGDIVFARTGATVGKSFLIEEIPFPAVYASYLIRIQLLDDIIPEFIYQFFNSHCYWEQITDKSVGVGQPNVNGTSLKNLLIPLAPMMEQERIIPASRSALKMVTAIDSDTDELLSTITTVKSKILDLAIHGKLVPQDPNDEPASVLLERIRAEKEELIRQGKIKRDKKDSVIFKGEDNSYYEKVGSQVICIDSEIPFDLPTNWAWTHMREICIINPRSSVPDNTEVSFIPMPLIQEGFANSHSSENRFWVQVKSGFTHFHENDIGVAKITPCFENRKSVVFHNLKNGIGAGTTELHILRPKNNFILSEYILMILKTNNFILEGVQTFSSAVGQQRIRKEYVADYLVPLPPYQEQQRIYSRVSRIFDQLSDIETNLS